MYISSHLHVKQFITLYMYTIHSRTFGTLLGRHQFCQKNNWSNGNAKATSKMQEQVEGKSIFLTTVTMLNLNYSKVEC